MGGERVLERVLDRLWVIADTGPEMTRGSFTCQVKALSMIVAIKGLVPNRRSSSSTSSPRQAATRAPKQQENAISSEPSPALDQEEAELDLAKPESAPTSTPTIEPAADTPPLPGITAAEGFSSSETTPSAPNAPTLDPAPDTEPFWRRFEKKRPGHAPRRTGV